MLSVAGEFVAIGRVVAEQQQWILGAVPPAPQNAFWESAARPVMVVARESSVTVGYGEQRLGAMLGASLYNTR